MEKLQQTNNKTSKKRRMEMGKERSKHEDNRKNNQANCSAGEQKNKKQTRESRRIGTHKTRFKLCYSFLNCDNSQILKRREPGVRKAGGELIKTNLNYGSKDDVRDVYIFFLSRTRDSGATAHRPDDPRKVAFRQRTFRNTKPVTNLNEAKSLHSMGKL